MSTRTSVKALARAATRDDTRLRAKIMAKEGNPQLEAVGTVDSFVNFAHKIGFGADNALSTSSYGFNPITRQRTLLEWIHRGSWLGGVAVELVADDMTRAGVEILAELQPGDTEAIDRTVTSLQCWPKINECVRWGSLYGGAICVALIDGQDMRTPLRPETVGPDQFKGLLTLDRWMVEPTLEDLVTDLGPQLGKPKYYRVQANAPALRGQAIHYSRVMIRHVGIELPYQQALTENLWGESVLERLYDRMIAFDSASMGVAQLVYKAYIRTLKVKGLREVVSQGGKALDGLTAYVQQMRRYQGMEGVTMLDGEDEFEVQGIGTAMSGMDSALLQLAQQLAGALKIPLVRLFGQSPGGLGSNGDSETRQYYDHINQQQMKELHAGVTMIYRLVAASRSIKLPDTFAIDFRSLLELSDTDKANIAKTTVEAVTAALDINLVSQQTGMKELRQSSRRTGLFTNITEKDIAQAEDTVEPPPSGELALMGPDGMPIAEGQPPVPGAPAANLKPPGTTLTNASARPRSQLRTAAETFGK